MSKQLHELAEVHYGKSPRGFRVEVSDIPILATSGRVGWATQALFDGPLTVVARKGTLDNPTYSPDPCWVIDTAYAVKAKSEIDSKWLYYQLDNYDLASLNEATGVPSISRDYLYRIDFHTPPLPEQRKIARILSTVDEQIESTEALIAKYQAMKQGLMHDLLTRGVDAQGRLRPPREQAPELYKWSALGWVPRGWEVVRLGDVCQFASGGTPARTNPAYWDGAIPWIKTAEVDYCVITKTEENITELGLLGSSAKVFPKGTLIMAIYGEGITRGKVAILGIEAATNQACLAFFSKSFLENNFLYHYFVASYWHLRELSHDGSQKNLSAALLGNTLVPVPGIVEQNNISTTIRSLEMLMEKEQSQLSKLQHLKTGLMQDLLTGRVRVEV